MKTTLHKFNGSHFKRLSKLKKITRERIVVNVQEKGYPFSIGQLSKLVNLGYIPQEFGEEIVDVIAESLECNKKDLLLPGQLSSLPGKKQKISS